MPPTILRTLVLSTTLSLPFLVQNLPHYALTPIILIISWNHFFPIEPKPPNYDTLPPRKEFLKSLTKHLESDDDNDEKREEEVKGQRCPTCWEDLSDLDPSSSGNKPFKLSCNHIFCTNCLTHWFVNSGNSICPVCKTALFQQSSSFVGKQRWLEIMHQVRTILAIANLTIGVVNKVLVLITRHPISSLSLSYLLNAWSYHADLFSLIKMILGSVVGSQNFVQVALAIWLGKHHGVYWWKALPGAWWLWLIVLPNQINDLVKELNYLPVYWKTAGKVVEFWWIGGEGTFLMRGVERIRP